METELNAICKDILTLLDESLITKAGPAEPAVFYQKVASLPIVSIAMEVYTPRSSTRRHAAPPPPPPHPPPHLHLHLHPHHHR